MTIVLLDEPVLQEQVANDAFVPLAIEAGIETLIKSLTTLATTKFELLMLIKATLAQTNPPLAKALGLQTLDGILKYMRKRAAGIVLGDELPELLDQDGPAGVWVARDVGTQVNITCSEPPEGFHARIYLDGIFQKQSVAVPAAGNISDSIQGVGAGAHTIRVLFRRDSDGAQTRFGPIGVIAE